MQSFCVGDTVEIIGPNLVGDESYIGRRDTILEVGDTNCWLPNSRVGDCYIYPLSSLRRAAAQPAGEVVKNVWCNGLDHCSGCGETDPAKMCASCALRTPSQSTQAGEWKEGDKDLIEWATLLWDWECTDSFSVIRHDYDHPWSKAATGQPSEYARRQTAMNICKRILEANGVKVEPHGKDVRLTTLPPATTQKGQS